MQELESEQKVNKVRKRNGEVVSFDSDKIRNAIKKAFIAQGISNEETFDSLTNQVVHLVDQKFRENEIPTVENVQDFVETVLILNRHAKVAKAYILYRSEHQKKRTEETLSQIGEKKLFILNKNGEETVFDSERLKEYLENVSRDLTKVDVDLVVMAVVKNVYPRMPISELKKEIISVTKSLIEVHYDYSFLSSRLLFSDAYERVLGTQIHSEDLDKKYMQNFGSYIEQGISYDLLSKDIRNFDLRKIAAALKPERDKLFHFLGAQTIIDRYCLRERDEPKEVFELPQWMWMRISMGLAIDEEDKEERAIEFYNVLSKFDFVSSTPTLFNSGTTRPQMSSCFLNTVEDSMTGIFKAYSDNALLCKWAGAVGTDWTPVRSKGSPIKGTNGHSQGIIPWIKIFNDCAVAVNQGGKRTGQLAAYLEVWHRDVEEFLELKKNTGDERRRAHDIHPAAWVPDLFMQRVKEDGKWTLFDPKDAPELHDSYGSKFKEIYEEYERKAENGEIYNHKVMKAKDLWKKMLTMLFENGHPWITFKDPCNIRSPQDHVGVVHASNLCTEITLNTNKEETAVCNLGSINLAQHISDGDLDEEKIQSTLSTAIRMLNNVVDLNFYTIPETRTSNMRHRPIGLGMMGYQDALYQLKIEYDSEEQLEFADKSMEMISFYALLASSELAKEFGPYPTYRGSKWDRGLLPIDTMDLLEEERGEEIKISRKTRMNWDIVRQHIREHGMRNSNVMAIAPTATIANISGVVPCVEPIYKNMYMKENMSGNFVVINRYLLDSLEELGLWNERIINQIKINNGSILNIDEIPADIRRRFKEVFEINPRWIVVSAALRAKWIDQSASTNIFVKTRSGKELSQIYMQAWEAGLKTTYYLRTLAASQITKMIDTGDVKTKQAENPGSTQRAPGVAIESDASLKVCSIDDEDCEACQ